MIIRMSPGSSPRVTPHADKGASRSSARALPSIDLLRECRTRSNLLPYGHHRVVVDLHQRDRALEDEDAEEVEPRAQAQGRTDQVGRDVVGDRTVEIEH